jgi:Protein of unknown function (DUF3293)
MHPALLHAYHQTGYQAAGIDIRIGRRCPAMDRLLVSHGARAGVFITAYNPHSRRMPPGWNRRMQGRLRLALRRRLVLPARGSWRGWCEAHLLVFADPRPVQQLARRYRQYAIVIVRPGQPACLMIISRTVAGPSFGKPPRASSAGRGGRGGLDPGASLRVN